jgi:hypothetical protein
MVADPAFLDEAMKQGAGAKAKAGGPKAKAKLEHVSFADAEPSFGGRKLVKGWLEQEQTSLIFGPSGCRKTFMMMDLALHVAAGWDWGGSKVRQGGVIYVAAEAGRSILNRVYAFKLHHGLEGVVLPFEVVTSPVDLCTKTEKSKGRKNDVEELVALVEEVGARMTVKPTLIIIDTVARALAGGNENSPDDIGRFVRALDWLRDKLRCHVASIHHIGKERERGARGHSSLLCAIDTAIEVEATDDVSTATIVKQRDGMSGGSRSFRLRVVELGRDEDGDPVTSCVLEWTDAPPPRETGRPSKNPQVALDALKETLHREGRDDDARGRVVELAKWELACKVHGFGVKPESFRNTWKRASEPLMTREGPVGFDPKGLVVWIKAQGQLPLDDEPF